LSSGGAEAGWAPRREIWAWAMFDFANSGYTTVVLTAVFNAYFVGVVAAQLGAGTATLLWTLAIATANTIVLLGAPILGALADAHASKKRYLMISTGGCILFTAALSFVGEGDIVFGLIFLVASNVMFATGENLIAAFLPEIAPPSAHGRISAYGWSLGYLGGLGVLGLCMAYIQIVGGDDSASAVPATMMIVAVAFGLAAFPTMVWLRERAVAQPTTDRSGGSVLAPALQRLRRTLGEARQFRDLYRFLIALTIYQSGVHTVIVIATVYAQQVMGFGTVESLWLILVVNLTAAAGAFLFGPLQDRFGSIPTLAVTLVIWIVASVLAYLGESRAVFWVAANLIGIALGSSQSAGRALVGRFTPAGRNAEWFGLWGMSIKLAAVIGPLSFGLLSYLAGGNLRTAILSTIAFFVVGLILLLGIDEKRGMAAATHATPAET